MQASSPRSGRFSCSSWRLRPAAAFGVRPGVRAAARVRGRGREDRQRDQRARAPAPRCVRALRARRELDRPEHHYLRVLSSRGAPIDAALQSAGASRPRRRPPGPRAERGLDGRHATRLSGAVNPRRGPYAYVRKANQRLRYALLMSPPRRAAGPVCRPEPHRIACARVSADEHAAAWLSDCAKDM